MNTYDFNLIHKFAKQTVRLTFQDQDYIAEIEEVVGGNCSGLTVIESALSIVYESDCPEDEYGIHIVMMNPEGYVFKSYAIDHIAGDEEWLKDMLVKAEIIDIQPDN